MALPRIAEKSYPYVIAFAMGGACWWLKISVASPKPIMNSFDVNFDEAYMATVVGLLEYSLGKNRSYQLDSSKKLVRPVQKERPIESINMQNFANKPTEQKQDNYEIKNSGGMDLTHLVKERKKEGIGKLFKKVTEWF